MRVVATLTTRPDYHKGLKETLESLTSQFDDVYLGLPEISRDSKKYPPFSHPKVKVVKLAEDIGPASKILAGIIMEKNNKDTLIVSVDDDHCYNQNLRTMFEKERLEDIRNNKCRVFTQAGAYIKYWNFNTLGINGITHDNNLSFDSSKNPKLTTIAGVCGVAYPNEIFLKNGIQHYIDFINNISNDRILFRNDDVTISAYLSYINFDKVAVQKTMIDYGKPNKDESLEKISPDREELFEACRKMKKYLSKNNDFKIFSLTYIDVIFFLFLTFFLFLYFYIFYKSKF